MRSRARALIERVARAHHFEGNDLYSPSREQLLCQARQSAMYVLNKGLRLPKAEIGRLFGKDHTTVIHAIQQVESSPRLRQLAENIIATTVPDSLPSEMAVTDGELQTYLRKLDEMLKRGNGLRRLLTGRDSLEVAN